jgi:hypothetical protein
MNRTALALLQERLWQAAVGLQGGNADSKPSSLREGLRLRDDAALSLPHGGESPEGELRTVLQALERIDQGLYGVCDRCGQTIDPDQLFDRPQRFACAACDLRERA